MNNKKIRVVIIDDEPYSRKDLKAIISEIPDVVVVGEGESVDSALEIIKKENPDLVFLDIEMPGKSGFELLEIENIKPKIIFVTAHDEYALRAFEVNAQDYLLKPVTRERLEKALNFFSDNEQEIQAEPERQLNIDDCVYLTINNKNHFIRINNIIYISAANDASEIFTSDGKKGLVFKPLKEWEKRLPPNYFVRIHRSTIINIDKISKIEKWFNNTSRVKLDGTEKEFVISRRYAAQIKQKYS